ncbi:mucoidy inhibitor MuiA family protein [Flavobacterium sp.]|uniref:mucoidy inhibitor MuiA family protein n=1 Tax=Flavobacterium sp. TaxID=239 RepID=UPI002FDB11AC
MKTIVIFLLSTSVLWANDIKTKATPKEVIVYLNGALVSAEATATVSKGTSVIRITEVSPFINQNSIQISGLKDVSILSIGYDITYLPKKTVSDKVKALQNELNLKQREVAQLQNANKGLEEEESLLSNNKKLSSEQHAATLEKLNAFSKHYRERITSLKMEIYDNNKKINQINSEINLLNQEFQKLNSGITEEKGEISIKVDAPIATVLNLIIKYNVSNAGWFPTYEIKAQNTKESLNFLYKAHVYQKTSEDWNDVKLTLSTGNPSFTNEKPEVEPHFLNFVKQRSYTSAAQSSNYTYNPTVKKITGVVTENGQPLPGANVIVKGTSYGVTTDFDGRYTLNAIGSGKELEISFIGMKTATLPIYSTVMNVKLQEDHQNLGEVVVTGYSNRKVKSEVSSVVLEEEILTGTGDEKSENLTTVVFKIKKNYSVPSQDEVAIIEIDTFEIPAQYEYFSAPLLSENVFLTAKIKDWEKYDLLAGEASIYAEGSYAGKTFIDPFQTSDELVISLGVDPNLVVERKQLNNFKDKSLFGSNRIISKNYEITLKNNKTSTVTIKLYDRIPIAQDKEIKVDKANFGDAKYDEKKGIVVWELQIPTKQTVKRQLSYEVKYPNGKHINL